MERIIAEEEFKQICESYKTAIDRRDYQETRRFNELLYESEFLKYRVLVGVKRLFEKQGIESEVRKSDLMINSIAKRLESLLEVGLELAYVQRGEK